MKILSLISLFTLFFTLTAEAKLIQIIHTNDLHSHLDGIRDGRGGYARLKTTIDTLRAEARANNIPSLYLDGGDFGEGSTYFFSNHGTDSLKALDLLGVNATVLGNHDYILGGDQLATQIKASGLKTPILSANVKGKKKMGLEEFMPDSMDFVLDGLKIRVVGLTTPDLHFQYPLKPQGHITSPHKAGIKAAKKFAKSDADFLIALTHTGVDRDKKLALKSKSIGLIVGGHDHVRISKPLMQTNKEGYDVPILQAGSNSMSVGSLIIDIQDRKATIIDYRLIDITPDLEENNYMAEFVKQADSFRNDYFGGRWDEVIGFSKIDLTGEYEGLMRNNRSCWSRHIARLTRETVGSDLGFQFDLFQGQEITAGPIKYGDIVENFPHFRKWGDQGWTITKGKVSGLLLKLLIKGIAGAGPEMGVTIDGLTVREGKKGREVNFDFQKHTVSQALVNGESIGILKNYTISLPSEVIYGMSKTSSLVTNLAMIDKEILPNTNYWPLLEDYIKKNSPIECLED
jgi:5'-nucleotidase / UDP-sugar diphosphatase